MAAKRSSAGGPGMDTEALFSSFSRYAKYSLGKPRQFLTHRDMFSALSLGLRDRLVERMMATEERYAKADLKRMYFISMEFLMGRSLMNNLQNLGLLQACQGVLADFGVALEDVEETECDAALGNGGLGRLAACFLDSLATLDLPGYGYGINYEYGLFRQEIDDGNQREKPDNWLAYATPWEIERAEESCIVPLYGRIEHGLDREGHYNPMWSDWKVVIGVPYDMPVAGYGGRTVNYLRLFSARSSHDFDMQIFNEGEYLRAVEQKIKTETISKVLYPSDSVGAGRELRLVQEYFLVACTIRDIVRRYLNTHETFDKFASKVAIHLNDTHPTLAIAELMRLLVDEKSLPWEQAWDITQATFGYTNHTLMPEALEKWPVSLLETVLPRHLQIIYEINHRFLDHVAAVWPGDAERLRRMSLIEEGEPKSVRMAHLAIAGSHSINGVSALHSDLVKSALVPDFHQLWPDRFNNKTNGVTQRRWLLTANPELAALITKTVGSGWITRAEKLRGLEAHAEDPDFQKAFLAVKRSNKERLAKIIKAAIGVTVNPDSLFDVHVKRIHQYKRQLLKVMHVIHQYFCMVEDHQEPKAPRSYIFAGKAAPGYWIARQIIKLINSVGRLINGDHRVRDLIKVAFIPDYRVSLAERIIPAADLSEQISTAGTEASGTGNMKLALNGALTIGTLDGANIEIQEEVGEENIYIFGLHTPQIEEMRRQHSYDPAECCKKDPRIQRVMDSFRSNMFCPEDPGLFDWVYQGILLRGDEYFHVADFPFYIAAQDKVEEDFTNRALWARKAILNVARMGKFSSDRTITEYAEEIWDLRPAPSAARSKA